MNVLRRVWQVYADRAGSETASLLKVAIPFESVCWVLRVMFPDADWPPLSTAHLWDIVMWFALLWVVRQRDEARAALKVAGVAKR